MQRKLFPAATDADFSDWRWQMRHAVRSLAELEKLLPLTDDERRGCEATAGTFRLGITPYYLSLIDPDHPHCPVRMQAIPVAAEAVCQVVAQVFGNDAAVAFGGAAGNLELNVMLPVIARNLLESIRLLASASRVFADKCVIGIEANVERCKEYAESSPSVGTSLNPHIGYEKAAEVIKESTKTGRSIREIVLERGLMTDAELDKALDVLALTKGGIAK